VVDTIYGLTGNADVGDEDVIPASAALSTQSPRA
jgi:hypothetical protein